MPKYWIVAVSEESRHVVKEARVFGAPGQGREGPPRARRHLDILCEAGRLRQAPREVRGGVQGGLDLVQGGEAVVDGRSEGGRAKYLWRTRLEPLKPGVADFKELAPRLSFIENKERQHAYLVRTPANFRRPLPEEDAMLIMESMK